MAKNITKNNFWDFFSSIHASLKLLHSLCFSTYMKMVNSTWFYGPGTTTFAYKVFIFTTLITQSFDLKMTYFRRQHSQTKDLATSCLVYRIWNNRQILMFKVSKWPYRSCQHDRIICMWCHYIPSGQKWKYKIISVIWRATGLKFGI